MNFPKPIDNPDKELYNIKYHKKGESDHDESRIRCLQTRHRDNQEYN